MSDPKQNDSGTQPREVRPDETTTAESPSACSPTQIGRFQVERELGRGGMGVVYLAHDPRLDRSVAIKSLPPEVVDNPATLARLKREAKILASLNHPNIAAIHEELEEAGTVYLVLEYVEGQALADRLTKETPQLNEALRIALQIAEALAAANNKGVIHRDLKPGNIKITPERIVKVLDFGIAKSVAPKADDDQSTLTDPGHLVGTPAYMSPEQVRGKAVDHRSDIWSFGCVLYEMLTGSVPFKGKTHSDTLANILRYEPDWHALTANIPASIRILLRRCLQKDPSRRLQHIGDAAIEIQETLKAPGMRTARWKSTPSPLFLACLLIGLGIGVIAAGIALKYTAGAPPAGQAQTLRTVLQLPENQTVALSRSMPLGTAQPAVAVAPDGSCFVYVANLGNTTQLFLRRMDELEAKPIARTEGAFAPFFSPDSRSIGFFMQDKLKTVSLLGGEPVTVCDARNPKGACWGPDGDIYFVESEGSRLSRVAAVGGTSEWLSAKTDRKQESDPRYGYPQLLPRAGTLLVSSYSDIYALSLETLEKKLIIRDGKYPRYIPTGHILYARAGAIEAVRFNPRTLRTTGPPLPVLEGVMLDSRYGTAQCAFSNGGLLVYVPGGDTTESTPVWIDREGNIEPLSIRPQTYGMFKLSPNGEQVAIQLNEGIQSSIHIYDVDRGTLTRLTQGTSCSRPIWTPDGKRVTFASSDGQGGICHLSWKPVDGSSDAQPLYSGQRGLLPCSWSPDGKTLAFRKQALETGSDIWALHLEGGHEPQLIVGTEFLEWGATFSPDGRYVAYTSDKDGKYQVYVQSYPTAGRVWQISRDFGEEPIWSLCTDELFYRNGDRWMTVSVKTEPTFETGTPQVLFEGPYMNVPGISYDVAPDTKRFLVLKPVYDNSSVTQLHLVFNWFDEIKRIGIN